MDIRTYRATTMQEALSQVRRDLGEQAVILHTRELTGNRLLRWIPGIKQVEVTASVEVNVPSRLPAPMQEAISQETSNGQGLGCDSPFSSSSGDNPASPGELSQQLSELQSLVETLCQRSRTPSGNEIPEQLFQLFADLIESDFEETLARELVEWVRTEASGEVLNDPDQVKEVLAGLLEEEIQIGGPIRGTSGKCHTVALVGPTGVGKTTTIAKLAAQFRLREQLRVGLITVDTYRIAAVEQLRTYADIIDLPMKVVATPREMREAVQSFSHLDLVLMDTAGRSPRDEVKIQELKVFLSEADVDEVLLVLSGVASAGSLQRTAERFGSVGTDGLIVTKLDEATGLGNLFPLVRQSRLPLRYVTTGQRVPDDIETGNARRLSRLMLGMEHASFG
ncbi:Flagellar biosynthesis protein FlhF [Planctomycetales bacterium 10988]|nr:Flagellar biosynthesis protein FlhF [Planctomycetales bacterium 10988]